MTLRSLNAGLGWQITDIPAFSSSASCASFGPDQRPTYRLIPIALYRSAFRGACSQTAIGKYSSAADGPFAQPAYGDWASAAGQRPHTTINMNTSVLIASSPSRSSP